MTYKQPYTKPLMQVYEVTASSMLTGSKTMSAGGNSTGTQLSKDGEYFDEGFD